MGADPIDLVVAFEELGRHAVPGPWVESAAYLPRLLAATDPESVTALAEGAVGSVLVTGHSPCALDTDIADHVYVVAATTCRPPPSLATPVARSTLPAGSST